MLTPWSFIDSSFCNSRLDTAALSVSTSSARLAGADHETFADDDGELVVAAARALLVGDAAIHFPRPFVAVLVLALFLNAHPACQAHQTADATGVGDLQHRRLVALAIRALCLRDHDESHSGLLGIAARALQAAECFRHERLQLIEFEGIDAFPSAEQRPDGLERGRRLPCLVARLFRGFSLLGALFDGLPKLPQPSQRTVGIGGYARCR